MLIQPHIQQAKKTKGATFAFTYTMKQNQAITSPIYRKLAEGWVGCLKEDSI